MVLLYRVGLHTNEYKLVGMVCHLCNIVDVHLEAAYTLMVTGMGTSFQKRQREVFWCPKCELEFTAGSLITHCQA